MTERHKQINDPRHSLHGHQEVRRRLKFRRSFVTVEGLEQSHVAEHRLERWQVCERQQSNEALPDPEETLPPGSSLIRKDWITLNRARTKVGKTKDNLHKWGITTSPDCECGETQTMDHILKECPMGPHCSDQDLKEANETALKIRFYRDKILQKETVATLTGHSRGQEDSGGMLFSI